MYTIGFFASLLGCTSILAVSIHTANAQTPNPSGTALAVVQATSAAGPGGSRMLEPQRPVFSGDRINTGAVGEAQIRFVDDTRLVVGPNSSLVIDKFVFAGNQTATEVGMRAVKGAFRFISGSSPSQAYTIKTPSATLGVRGTQFDVAVGRNGETGLIVLSGAVRMCGRSGQCILVDEACGAAIALPNGRVSPVTSQADKAARINQQFPYIVAQASLRREFRVNTRACGGTATAAPGQGFSGFAAAFSAAISGGNVGGPGSGGPSGGPGNGNGNAGNAGNGGGNTGGSGPGTGNGGGNAGLGAGASNGGGGEGNGGAGGAGGGGAGGGGGGAGGGGGGHGGGGGGGGGGGSSGH